MEPESSSTAFQFFPLTAPRWDDFETLFGKRGACGGCWCTYWRLKRSDFNAMRGEGARAVMRSIVESGEVPGILAYDGDQPVGWCAVAPRAVTPVLERSRILKPVDDQPVWSVTCFFVAKPYRRHGLTVELLKAAACYAREQGARVLEGYPSEPKKTPLPDPFIYTGIASAFRKAGFQEAARRSETRPIMRIYLEQPA